MGLRTRGRRIFRNVTINPHPRPDDLNETVQLAPPRVVSHLCGIELPADGLYLNKVDARKAVRRPRDDAIRHAAPAGRDELLAHAAVLFDLLNEVLLDDGFVSSAFLFARAHFISGTYSLRIL
jgi:hypothetical protein